MALRSWLQSLRTNPAPKHTRRTSLSIQQLEDRTVPTVSLSSAFGTTSDTSSSYSRDIAVDTAGNSYLTGGFKGTVDFDPAHDQLGGADVLTALGTTDIFVAKYAPDNALVWVRRMGGSADTSANFSTDYDDARSIALDASGNVYVTGRFSATADFGSVSLTSAGRGDGFVAKFTASGAVSWAKRWGTAQDEEGLGVAVDGAGNVAVVGGRTYITTTGSIYTVDNNHGLDILKYTPTGGTAWAPKWVNTRSLPQSADLKVDASGSLFVAGEFDGTVDLDPGTKWNQSYTVTSGPSHAGFVLKLTSAGSFAWASPFLGQFNTGTSCYSSAQSLALDGSGNVFVAGSYTGVVDFDPGAGTTNLPTGGGGYIAKLTPTGGLAWARAMEKDPAVSNSYISVYGLATDAAGSVYATGTFQGGLDFDSGAGSLLRRSVRNATDTADSNDVFVVKLTATGIFAWAETFGGSENDIGWGVAVDPSGLVYLIGNYTGSVDFDPDPLGTNVLNSTARSLFLVKLRQN
jgi:hypothetical protein